MVSENQLSGTVLILHSRWQKTNSGIGMGWGNQRDWWRKMSMKGRDHDGGRPKAKKIKDIRDQMKKDIVEQEEDYHDIKKWLYIL